MILIKELKVFEDSDHADPNLRMFSILSQVELIPINGNLNFKLSASYTPTFNDHINQFVGTADTWRDGQLRQIILSAGLLPKHDPMFIPVEHGLVLLSFMSDLAENYHVVD